MKSSSRLALLAAGIVLLTLVPDMLLASPGGARITLVAAIAAATGLLFAVPGALDRLERLLTSRRTVVAVVVGWIAVAAVVNWLRLRAFQDANGRDLAYHCQVLWNSAHGAFGSGSILQQLYFDPPLNNHLGLHVSPAFLALTPLYALAPHQATLLALKVLATALATIPLYALAKRALGAAPACLIVIAFLLHPTILEQMKHEFYPAVFSVPALLAAWWCWERKRFGWFVVSIVALISVREDLGLTLCAFVGVWALEWWSARRSFVETVRPKRWALVPLVIGAGWFVLSTRFLMPHFGGSPVAGNVMNWYSGWGDSPDDLVRGVLTDPVQLLAVLCVGTKALYIWQLGRPFLLAPVASRVALLALPALAVNMLVTGNHPTVVATTHYSLVITAVLAAATVEALREYGRRRGPQAVLSASVVIAAVALTAVTDTFHSAAIDTLRRPAHADSIEAALELVPENATVAAPNTFLSHVANTSLAYDSEQIGHYPAFSPDVVIMDLDPSRSATDDRDEAGLAERVARFRASLDYETALERDDIVVFRRHDLQTATGR